MKRIKCRVLSLLLSCMLLTACGDNTVVTNNTQPNRVTVATTAGIDVTEPIVTDSVVGDNTGDIDEVEQGTAAQESAMLSAKDFGNFIMLPAEYNYNWTSRVVIPEGAKLKINVVTNLLDLLDEPNNTFVDLAYNMEVECKKQITTNDLTLMELFDGVVGIDGIYGMKDVIYYYMVFLTDERGNDLEKPYVLPITIADIMEVPIVTLSPEKCLRFSDGVELMPVSRTAIDTTDEGIANLLKCCDEYIGVMPITVSHFDSVIAKEVNEVSAQDLKHYAQNDIALVYRGIDGDKRSAWKYIDCSQFASILANRVVNFDKDFVNDVSSAETYNEFLDIMPAYMDVEYCDGEVRTVPVRYSFENNSTSYGIREPDFVMLEKGYASDIVLDCEAVSDYFKTTISFNENLNRTEVTEWLSALTKRQALYKVKTSPLIGIKTGGVDMTINDNTTVVLNIASMYKDIKVDGGQSEGTMTESDDHFSINFGSEANGEVLSEFDEGTDLGADIGVGGTVTGNSNSGMVYYDAKMGNVCINADDSAQVAVAKYLIDTETTFRIPISEFDMSKYNTLDEVAELPYRVMLKNPLVPYILESGCVVTKTDVIYTVRYILDSETVVAWQKSANAAAYDLAVTLKSINDMTEKYSRLNTQLTVGAEYNASFVDILKTVDLEWSELDKKFLALYTPYGLFTDNVAADYGYATAYKLVCDLAGLPCEIVQGTANGYIHTWNRVCIDNQWYNVDAAINDVPVGVSDVEREFRDRCLFVSDAQMGSMYKSIYSENKAELSKDAMRTTSKDGLSEYLLSVDLDTVAKGSGVATVKMADVPSVYDIRTISDSAYGVYISKGGSVDIGDSVLIYTLDGVISYVPLAMLEKVVN